MILLLAGTKDARLLVPILRNAFPDADILASAVSEYGAELLRGGEGCEVLQGKLDAGAISALIRERGIRVLVDATHPFAEKASSAARLAATEAKIPCLRYERPQALLQERENIFPVPDFKAAALLAAGFSGTIFLTIGTRHLAEFLAALPERRKVVARVLPEAESICACREMGLTPAEIIAIQGPLSVELNAALFTAFQAGVVVSKESGETGGTGEKAEAARILQLPLILVSRPPKPQGINCTLQLVSELRKIIC
jgi:precorrin-6A/cobalt-precorrin-6A reductase